MRGECVAIDPSPSPFLNQQQQQPPTTTTTATITIPAAREKKDAVVDSASASAAAMSVPIPLMATQKSGEEGPPAGKQQKFLHYTPDEVKRLNYFFTNLMRRPLLPPNPVPRQSGESRKDQINTRVPPVTVVVGSGTGIRNEETTTTTATPTTTDESGSRSATTISEAKDKGVDAGVKTEVKRRVVMAPPSSVNKDKDGRVAAAFRKVRNNRQPLVSPQSVEVEDYFLSLMTPDAPPAPPPSSPPTQRQRLRQRQPDEVTQRQPDEVTQGIGKDVNGNESGIPRRREEDMKEKRNSGARIDRAGGGDNHFIHNRPAVVPTFLPLHQATITPYERWRTIKAWLAETPDDAPHHSPCTLAGCCGSPTGGWACGGGILDEEGGPGGRGVKHLRGKYEDDSAVSRPIVHETKKQQSDTSTPSAVITEPASATTNPPYPLPKNWRRKRTMLAVREAELTASAAERELEEHAVDRKDRAEMEERKVARRAAFEASLAEHDRQMAALEKGMTSGSIDHETFVGVLETRFKEHKERMEKWEMQWTAEEAGRVGGKLA